MLPASRPAAVGLGASAAVSVRAFFEAFRWEPPPLDPEVLTVRELFDRLADAAGDALEERPRAGPR